MQIAFINPPNTAKTGERGENAAPPLGLCYIAAYLIQSGFPVDLFDLADENPLSLSKLEELDFFRYQIYGFTK